jgi:ribosome-associated toxin RatA of RatAB toxin-antitoxin module
MKVESNYVVDTCISRHVHASAQTIFDVAARVEDWPRLLPHYRAVRVLHADQGERVVEMAAYRSVVGNIRVPLWWVAAQRVYPEEGRIEFRHVQGVTRGMWVEWSIAAEQAGCFIRIRHVFWPRWAVPDVLVRAVVGEYFVNGVARRTLACLAQQTQRPS